MGDERLKPTAHGESWSSEPEGWVFPRIIAVETVSTCNAACTFCPHPLVGKNASPQTMVEALFNKIVDEASREECLETFTVSFQNEPLTDPWLPQRLKTAQERLGEGVRVSLVTNGSLMSGRRLERLMEYPPDLVKVSFSGITAHEYESQMKGLSFERTLTNIEQLRQRAEARGKPEILVNTVYTAVTAQHSVEEIVEFWRQRGLRVHVMNVENRAGALRDQQEQLSGQSWNVRTWCKRPEEQLSIWPNGDVALCCADWQKDVLAGNVWSSSIREVWEGQIFRMYRSRLRSGDISELSPCNVCESAEVKWGDRRYVEFGKRAEGRASGLDEVT